MQGKDFVRIWSKLRQFSWCFNGEDFVLIWIWKKYMLYMYIHVVKPPDHAALITLIWQISLMRVNWQTDQRPHGKVGPALEASLADHPTAATKERKRKRCGWSLFAFVIFLVLLYDLISFTQLKCWNYCNISDWKFTPSFLKIINFFFHFQCNIKTKANIDYDNIYI